MDVREMAIERWISPLPADREREQSCCHRQASDRALVTASRHTQTSVKRTEGEAAACCMR